MEYTYFILASILGILIGMITIYVIYKRGLAIRINFIICLMCALYANAGFILGKMGITFLNATITLAILLPITIFMVLLFFREYLNPILKVNRFFTGLISGNIQDRLEVNVRDELKDLYTHINNFLDFLKTFVQVAEQVAGGNLAVQVTPQSQQDSLGESFASMIVKLHTMIKDVQEDTMRLQKSLTMLSVGARQAGMASSQIATTIQQVAVGTTQQSDSVSRTAASIEQMSRAITGVAQGAHEQSISVSKAAEMMDELNKAINQVTSSAEKVKVESDKAAEEAKDGSKTVKDTVTGMERIKTKVSQSAIKVQEMGIKSEKIGSIVRGY